MPSSARKKQKKIPRPLHSKRPRHSGYFDLLGQALKTHNFAAVAYDQVRGFVKAPKRRKGFGGSKPSRCVFFFECLLVVFFVIYVFVCFCSCFLSFCNLRFFHVFLEYFSVFLMFSLCMLVFFLWTIETIGPCRHLFLSDCWVSTNIWPRVKTPTVLY